MPVPEGAWECTNWSVSKCAWAGRSGTAAFLALGTRGGVVEQVSLESGRGNERKLDRCVGKVGHFSRPREAAQAMSRTLRTWNGLGQLEKEEGSGKRFSGQNSLALLAPGHC